MEFMDEKGELNSATVKLRFDKSDCDLAMRILEKSGEFYSQGQIYYPKASKREFLTVESAEQEFSKSNLTGVVFAQMMTVYTIDEKTLMVEFNKWKEANKLNPFKDARHLRNSFNLWLSKANLKPQTKSSRNWDKI
jgi:PDZ domain-containing secreted protein